MSPSLTRPQTLLGTGGVQGQVKGQRLMAIKAVNDSIGLATCQSKIYEKYPPRATGSKMFSAIINIFSTLILK